jgi:hypothetical protein
MRLNKRFEFHFKNLAVLLPMDERVNWEENDHSDLTHWQGIPIAYMKKLAWTKKNKTK